MPRRALMAAFIGSSLFGCALILGIDDGIPLGDGGTDGKSDSLADAKPEAAACNLAAPFKTPVALTSLNTGADQGSARLLPDELTIYFERTDDAGLFDLLTATRANTFAVFGAEAPITELSSPSSQADLTVSPDALKAFFASNRAGGL